LDCEVSAALDPGTLPSHQNDKRPGSNQDPRYWGSNDEKWEAAHITNDNHLERTAGVARIPLNFFRTEFVLNDV
jgi:hypothetical protein